MIVLFLSSYMGRKGESLWAAASLELVLEAVAAVSLVAAVVFGG